MNNSVVAIIPARGGSKRIPRKNIRNFAGKPMIQWSIIAAAESGLFNEVIVSTDDEEIAKVAKAAGAIVPFMRPGNLADDVATTDAVLQHAIKWCENSGRKFKTACCIYPTAPFVSPYSLRLGLERLMATSATSVIAVTTFAYPIFRALTNASGDRLKLIWPEYLHTRSQDLRESFHDAGQFYWLNIEKYKNSGRIICEDAVGVHIPRHLVQDIDTEEDWLVAERLFMANQQPTSNKA